MIYVTKVYWDQNKELWSFGYGTIVNPDHIVSITPTYVPPGAVLNTESGMGMVYDVETTAHNNGYALKLTGVNLDKMFEEGLKRSQWPGFQKYKGLGVTK